MTRRVSAPTAPARKIHVEAALASIGTCFSLDADGQAKLVLVVAAECAAPLSQAMAEGWLRDRTFLVTIEAPVPGPTPSRKGEGDER